MLDKNSPIPLYYQIAEQLREQAVSGALQPGSQLPSERDLSQQMQVSRMTARQAVNYLVRQGVLEVKPGVGTFVVAAKLTHDPLHLLSFSEEMLRQGGEPTSEVIEQVVVDPPANVAAELALSPTAQTVKIARLRYSQNTPLLLETVYLPTDLCPGLVDVDLSEKSLYGVLAEQYHLYLGRSRQTIEATIANRYEADLFGVTEGVPMLLLAGVTYSIQNQPVEYFKAVYRGDRFKFNLESQGNGYEIVANPAIISSMEWELNKVIHLCT